MALVAPMATWRPYTRAVSTTPLIHNVICAHTMVGTLDGSYSHGNGAGNPYHMFGLAGDGRLQQHHDLLTRSAANYEGNWRCIPIETEDKGPSFPSWPGTCGTVPAWTDAQVDRLVELIAWLCARFAIPPVLVPDSRPEHRGLAYHRQGCPPNVVAGGEAWSTSTGKCCPDTLRIDQFHNDVVPRVAAIVNGEGFLNMLTDAEQQEILEKVRAMTPQQADVWHQLVRYRTTDSGTLGFSIDSTSSTVQGLKTAVASLQTAVADVAKAIDELTLEPAPVDLASIAKAVNDDAAMRREGWT
jgi:hypothetical protein